MANIITDGSLATSYSGALSSLDDLLPLVSPFLVGAPEAVQQQALGLIVRDFCRETEIWRETIDLATVADQATYDLGAQVGALYGSLLRVRQIRFDDATSALSDEYYTVAETNHIVFDDTSGVYPDDWGTEMNVDAVILPNADTRNAPTWLLARWGEYIAEGALAHLKEQEGKPWTNPDKAAVHRAKYLYGIGEAKREKSALRLGGDVRVTPGTFV